MVLIVLLQEVLGLELVVEFIQFETILFLPDLIEVLY